MTEEQATIEFVAEIADTLELIEECQRLRYNIFAMEMGAELDVDGDLDVDHYDEFCDHLIIRRTDTGEIVGNTRLLREEQAVKAGGYYTQTEFEMEAILAYPGKRIEMGRTCVHPDFRSGIVVQTLLGGIIKFMHQNGYDMIFGCASIPWEGNGHLVYHSIEQIDLHYMIEEPLRMTPLSPIPPREPGEAQGRLRFPPLLKSYLSLGCDACGAPSWDPSFQTADVPILLRLENLSKRYARKFLDMDSVIVDRGAK